MKWKIGRRVVWRVERFSGRNGTSGMNRKEDNEGNMTMEIKELQKAIRTLATLEETDAPVISCYLDVSDDEFRYGEVVAERAALLRAAIADDQLAGFEEALEALESHLATVLHSRSRGVAIFSRGGSQKFLLPLQFQVALPNWMGVDAKPNIYHLVELKDTYHRYVVLISNQQNARILEINLGSVTEELWTQRPDLRVHLDKMWTRERYRHHREQQTEQFVREKVKLLDRLMSAGGHTHLIIAGEPDMTTRVRQALPHHLANKLVDIVSTQRGDSWRDVVQSTIAAFVQREEKESLAMVDRLIHAIKSDGLAVAGTEATLRVLGYGQADVLVMARDFDPSFSVKEHMVKLAEQQGCKVEIVNESEHLMRLGGVGCLLRFALHPHIRSSRRGGSRHSPTMSSVTP